MGASNKSAIINNCLNRGEINGNNTVGGIIGISAKESVVNYCINKGTVIGKADFVGGIMGICGGNVEKCYNEGTIIGTGSAIANKNGSEKRCEGLGGICGETGNNVVVIVRNCYNKGNIIDESENFIGVGGIVGYVATGGSSGEINNNYNIGTIEIKGNDVIRIGGVIGRIDTDKYIRKNNYYIEGTTRTQDNKEGESRTSEEMKTQTFVNELNKEQEDEIVWKIEEKMNHGYPILI